MKSILTVVLAGGRGTRLEPLTRDRAKPAVPFGGIYRIIDFTLSNCINSGLKKILLLTQYKAMSLDRHINLAWNKYFCRELGESIDIIPPQQRVDQQWYQGTADAVYQNIYAIEQSRPEYIVILAGDHIYKMNYANMIEFHRESGAELTIGALPVSLEEARGFGVMQIDPQQRIRGFQEKPIAPQPMPGCTDKCLASMGIYVFNAKFLLEELCRDATQIGSAHDFGKNIIPSVIEDRRVFAFPFADENRKTKPYWRDVGTLDAYYEASMDLISVDPLLNLYDEHWPIRTYQVNSPPPKFVFGSRADQADQRRGFAIDSMVCNGSIVSGAQVTRSIVGPNCRLEAYSHVESSVLFDRVTIGERARIRNAIIEKNVRIPNDIEIGFDPQQDQARGMTITESGLVVVAKGARIERLTGSTTRVTKGVVRAPFFDKTPAKLLGDTTNRN
ncbi:MAG: glucose-1-phosphate adenylyltransferase [Planctomycetaceae bacterium]|nr:glucose-1-phosphate adenylyltransferase [Planctomycetaceae bacterium]